MESLLKQFLAHARLGPMQRASIQRALASRDRGTMLRSGRSTVQALMRRGDLVKVTTKSGNGSDKAYHALRGHTGLLDLTPLFDPGTMTAETSPAESKSREAPAGVRGEIPLPMSDMDFEAQERLLHAMETAQALQVSPGGGSGAGAWLGPVLDMLAGYLSDLEIFVELHHPNLPPERADRLFSVSDMARPFWAATRVRGEIVTITEMSELPAPLQELAALTTEDAEAKFTAAVAVPVFPPTSDEQHIAGSEQEEIGLLYILSRHAMPGDQLRTLGLRLSRFVTHSWHQRLLMNRLVHTDQLTGVRNRGYFDTQFSLELERCKRQDSSLVLLLGDIDHFKHVNDSYGHQMGDRVLKTVARELLQGLRRIDIVCRVGGEEFALVLPDTTMEAARDVVTRIQVRIANLRLTDPNHPEPIRTTISFGGVSFPEGGEDHQTLYRVADQMLYLSKQRGRNRCHFWRADGDPLLTLPHYESS